jgi:hypothetical protein
MSVLKETRAIALRNSAIQNFPGMDRKTAILAQFDATTTLNTGLALWRSTMRKKKKLLRDIDLFENLVYSSSYC